MKKGGGPALEELAQEGDADSIKFSVSHSLTLNLNPSVVRLRNHSPIYFIIYFGVLLFIVENLGYSFFFTAWFYLLNCICRFQ